MARPIGPEQKRPSRADVSRFHQLIRTDDVFGTHKVRSPRATRNLSLAKNCECVVALPSKAHIGTQPRGVRFVRIVSIAHFTSWPAAITKSNNKKRFDPALCDRPELFELSPYLHHAAPLSARRSVRVTRELRNGSALGWRNLRRRNHVRLFVLLSQFNRNREGDHTKACCKRSWNRRRRIFIQFLSEGLSVG